jgi:hypothetical protein
MSASPVAPSLLTTTNPDNDPALSATQVFRSRSPSRDSISVVSLLSHAGREGQSTL